MERPALRATGQCVKYCYCCCCSCCSVRKFIFFLIDFVSRQGCGVWRFASASVMQSTQPEPTHTRVIASPAATPYKKKKEADHILPSRPALTKKETPPSTDRVASSVASPPSPLLPQQPPQSVLLSAQQVEMFRWLCYVTSIDRHCGPFVDCEAAAVRSRAGGRKTAFGTSSGMAA